MQRDLNSVSLSELSVKQLSTEWWKLQKKWSLIPLVSPHPSSPAKLLVQAKARQWAKSHSSLKLPKLHVTHDFYFLSIKCFLMITLNVYYFSIFKFKIFPFLFLKKTTAVFSSYFKPWTDVELASLQPHTEILPLCKKKNIVFVA